MRLNKGLAIFLIIVIVIVAGAWRQIIFINTNAQIKFLEGSIANSGLVNSMSFLADWDISTLNRFKWLMTIAFTIFFLALSSWALWIVFKERKVIIWLIYVYAGIFILSGIFFVLGKYIGSYQFGYEMSRKCMGALQSPFPLMMLLPSVYLINLQD